MNTQVKKVFELMSRADGHYESAVEFLKEGDILMSQLDLFPEQFNDSEKRLCGAMGKVMQDARAAMPKEETKATVMDRKDNVVYVDFRKRTKIAA
jgi:hypothetical protein